MRIESTANCALLRLKKLTIVFACFFTLAITSSSNAQDNSWFQTSGPVGATVGSIVNDSAGIMYAGTDAGVYRSTDDGTSWTNVGFDDTTVTSLVVGKSGTIYVAQGTDAELGGGSSSSSPCHGVYKSTDHGNTWTLSGLVDSSGSVGVYGVTTCLAISPSGDVYADVDYQSQGFSGDVLFKSSDGGDSWIQTGFRRSGLGSGAVSATDFLGNDTMLVAEKEYGVLRSTDSGTDWAVVRLGRTYCMAIDSGGDIFVGLDSGVAISRDRGSTWQASGLGSEQITSLSVLPSGKILAGAVSATGIQEVYSSGDGGATWDSTGLGEYVLCFDAGKNGQIFAGCLNDGIYRSTDSGGNWVESNTGLLNSTVISISIDSAGSIITGVANQGAGICKSTDGGKTWNRIAFADTAANVMVDNNGRIFACTSYGLFLSTDQGDTWKELLAEPTGVDCVAEDSSGGIYVGTPGILRSTDGGKSWVSLVGSGYFRSIVFCPDSSLVADGTGGIARSTDRGGSWTPVLTNDELNCLLINHQGELFAGSNDAGVYKSDDYGKTWMSASNGLTSPEIKTLAVNSKGYLYAGTWYGGVSVSTDDGNSWSAFNQGLMCPNIQSLGFDKEGYLYAGTLGHAVFRTEFSTPVLSSTHGVPNEYSLNQNYPNPFNPTTVITYDIAKRSHVMLTVYDVLGREVAVLVNADKSPGEYQATFNGSDLASGVYFYRIQAGKYSSTKKLVLVK